MIFFFNSPYWTYFSQGEDFKLTTELSEKVQNSHKQTIKNGLSNTAYANKKSFTLAIRFCVFQVTK